MKFVIWRTSGIYVDNIKNKPCGEAKLSLVESWNTRTCDEKTFNENFSEREGLWRSKGRNHSIDKNGYITRQMEDYEEWTVEFATLEELIAFSNKYGELVVQASWYESKYGSIEIYDDYRE